MLPLADMERRAVLQVGHWVVAIRIAISNRNGRHVSEMLFR